jgi:hypothetical protein
VIDHDYVRRLEAVVLAARALRPIGSPVSIRMMMDLEHALRALDGVQIERQP